MWGSPSAAPSAVTERSTYRRLDGSERDRHPSDARSSPGTGADLESGVSLVEPVCVWILTRPQLREVITQLRRKDRVAPTVVLTSRLGERDPAFSPTAIRRIIGSEPQLYIIRTGHLTDALAVKMGPRLAVRDGAARIWRADPSSHSADQHPLVAAPRSANDSAALASFAELFKTVRPLTVEYLDAVKRKRNEVRA